MIGVIFWSGTGNTERMAYEVAEGIKAAGQEVEVKSVSEVSVDEAATYEKLALGCADMGAEQLEEGEFEPFYTELEGKLSGKKIAIFGSYGWGGTWLEDWGTRIKDAGGELVADGVAILGEPDDDMMEQRSLKILISISKCDENHNVYLSLSLFVYISA